MTMIMDDGVVGNWYVELPEELGNWMMGARRTPEGEWDVMYRFRYYEDNKAHDSEDHKVWVQVKPPKEEPVEDVIRTCSMLAHSLAEFSGGKLYELIREPGESAASFFKRFAKQPWAHARMENIH